MPYDTGLAVDTHGDAWGWGNNGYGDLCLGSHEIHSTPIKLPMSHVTALAGASNHALYDAGGRVYACGQNVGGDLGTGTTSSTTTPVPVAGIAGWSVTELVASFANSGALLSDGSYYDWGYDRDGQLGDGRLRQSSLVPVLVRLRHPVTKIAQGGSIWDNGQTLALLSNGSLWAWGADRAGQLGNGKTGSQVSPTRLRPPPGSPTRAWQQAEAPPTPSLRGVMSTRGVPAMSGR